jgi:hypothetical protein
LGKAGGVVSGGESPVLIPVAVSLKVTLRVQLALAAQLDPEKLV